MKYKHLKKLIKLNTKLIEAFDNSLAQEVEMRKRRELAWEKEQKLIYQLLGQIALAQSDFYATQADFYERFDRLEERQARMTEILDRLDPHDRT